MKRRTFIRNLAAGVAVHGSVAGVSFPKTSQSKKEWKMATQFRVHQRHQEFAKIIAEASEGQLLINLISRGKKPLSKVLEEVRRGKTEMVLGNLLCSPSEEEGKAKVQKVPAADFLIMPFGLTALEYNAWIECGGGRELVDRMYKQIGCKYFPAGNTGIQMGGWFAKEINSIDDLKGLKIRISGFGAAAMKDVGAEPYDVAPWSDDAKNTLSAGKLDAFEFGNPDSDLNSGLHKRYKYYYYPAWHEPSVPFDLIINLDKWEALPPHLKTIISTTARWLNYQWLNECTARAAAALDTLVKKHGVQLRQFPATVLKELAKVSNQIMRERTSKDKLSQEVFDSIMLFRQKVSSWAMVSLQPFLTARGGL
jgi:TRAP-type mannitol/chloroaromatic compound transport system substrate-binding protein